MPLRDNILSTEKKRFKARIININKVILLKYLLNTKLFLKKLIIKNNIIDEIIKLVAKFPTTTAIGRSITVKNSIFLKLSLILHY